MVPQGRATSEHGKQIGGLTGRQVAQADCHRVVQCGEVTAAGDQHQASRQCRAAAAGPAREWPRHRAAARSSSRQVVTPARLAGLHAGRVLRALTPAVSSRLSAHRSDPLAAAPAYGRAAAGNPAIRETRPQQVRGVRTANVVLPTRPSRRYAILADTAAGGCAGGVHRHVHQPRELRPAAGGAWPHHGEASGSPLPQVRQSASLPWPPAPPLPGHAAAAATNSLPVGPVRLNASASTRAVYLRAVRLTPRSRSLMDRGLKPATSRQLLLGQLGLGPQLPQPRGEAQRWLLRHRPIVPPKPPDHGMPPSAAKAHDSHAASLRHRQPAAAANL